MRNRGCRGGSKNAPGALVVGKEKQLIALDRSTYRTAKLILNEFWSGTRGTEKVAGIEGSIAIKFENASVKGVRSGFRDHVHLSAAVVSVLCVEVVSDNSKLFDRIEIGYHSSAIIFSLFDIGA